MRINRGQWGLSPVFENLRHGDFDAISELFTQYGPDDLGFCYDAGHGNLIPDSLEGLMRLKDRLIAIHLHDNDGVNDLHRLPGMGTVPWEQVITLLGASSYRKCISMEVGMAHSGFEDEVAFLAKAHEVGSNLAAMLESARTT